MLLEQDRHSAVAYISFSLVATIFRELGELKRMREMFDKMLEREERKKKIADGMERLMNVSVACFGDDKSANVDGRLTTCRCILVECGPS